ncbi:MAG TPA: biotin/lipoyl-containing protein [Polyangiaceae bacterium]|jgi:biotin carboxyl carrier protein|nr:biotin/lipoyl-containing protein [Polyangiaceae bacterium]
MRYYVTLPGREEIAIDVVQRPGGHTDVHVGGEPIEVDVIEAEGALSVRVGDRVFDLWLEHDGRRVGFVGAGARTFAVIESERSRLGAAVSRTGDSGGGQVSAPMPGRVVKVLVKEGDVVEAGTPVVVVEAMKMENELCAEAPGVVRTIRVQPGENVEGGSPLLLLDPLGQT